MVNGAVRSLKHFTSLVKRTEHVSVPNGSVSPCSKTGKDMAISTNNYSELNKSDVGDKVPHKESSKLFDEEKAKMSGKHSRYKSVDVAVTCVV